MIFDPGDDGKYESKSWSGLQTQLSGFDGDHVTTRATADDDDDVFLRSRSESSTFAMSAASVTTSTTAVASATTAASVITRLSLVDCDVAAVKVLAVHSFDRVPH